MNVYIVESYDGDVMDSVWVSKDDAEKRVQVLGGDNEWDIWEMPLIEPVPKGITSVGYEL